MPDPSFKFLSIFFQNQGGELAAPLENNFRLYENEKSLLKTKK